MVACKIAGVKMEETIRWVIWLLGAFFMAMVLVLIFPPIATWLPRYLGY
jgi:TRAP-type C4-dicarboxylate transport system permease large subunit